MVACLPTRLTVHRGGKDRLAMSGKEIKVRFLLERPFHTGMSFQATWHFIKIFDSGGLGRNLRFCISKGHPGGVSAAGP